jgi:hypothetical protein
MATLSVCGSLLSGVASALLISWLYFHRPFWEWPTVFGPLVGLSVGLVLEGLMRTRALPPIAVAAAALPVGAVMGALFGQRCCGLASRSPLWAVGLGLIPATGVGAASGVGYGLVAVWRRDERR